MIFNNPCFPRSEIIKTIQEIILYSDYALNFTLTFNKHYLIIKFRFILENLAFHHTAI